MFEVLPAPCQRLLAASALDTSERQIPSADVLAAIERYYGFSGKLQRIPTEKDDTFRLQVDGTNESRLIKVSSSFEDPSLVDLQSQALDHLHKTSPSLSVPRIVRTLDGNLAVSCFAGDGQFPRVLRTLTYLPGRPLGNAPTYPSLRYGIGRSLAQLSLALSSMKHPRTDRQLVWDVQNFPLLEPLLGYVKDPDLRRLIERQFETFAQAIAPSLSLTSYQFLHDDLITANTIVSEQGIGIIDFGDIVYTAVPLDLAVCLSSHAGQSLSRPWDGIADIIRGYLSVRDLSDVEIEISLNAICVRIALRALLISYQSETNPVRRDYLLSHSSANKEILDALWYHRRNRPRVEDFRR